MKTRGKGQENLSTAERALQEKFKIIKQRRALQVRFSVPLHERHRYVSQIYSLDAAVYDATHHRYLVLL